MPDGAIKAKKGRKFEQVLDGARKVFMSDGYEGASVDDIARAAGVSKATLYSYFPDKRFLFMQIAKSACQEQAEHAADGIDTSAPAPQVLHKIATEMVEFITSEFGTRVFRICVAEGERFPELAREFYDCGPVLVRARMADYLRAATARGELQIDDVALAADQFHELCKSDLFARIVFSVTKTFSRAEKDRVINGAVEMFMARYSAKP